jgi:PAS domain S-box-containing protein
MVVVDAASRIEFVNLQTEKLFGYTRAELLGQELEILIPERFRSTHGGHVQRFFANPGSRPMGSGIELFGRRKDGTEIPIEVSLSPLGRAGTMTVSAAIRDITERKKLEAVARVNAQRLVSAVESMQDGFALFDDEDRLVLCNSVFRSLLGQSFQGAFSGKRYEELLEHWISDLTFKDRAEEERFRRDQTGPRAGTTTIDVRTRDGRSFRVVDRRTPEGGTVKTIWDLTDDVQRAEELRIARATAETASAAKSEFLSSMSHELRTPLNAILGFAQLLQRDKKEPLSARHMDRVSQILRGGEHLLRLIDDILDLSRIEAGAVSMSTEPVGVSDVLQEVLATLQPLASHQNVRLEMAPIPGDLPMVAADRTRFAQILMNFGSNAIKYNRPAGRVAFSVEPIDRMVRVSVRDWGMGIPAERQDKLFQPFQRAGQETGPIEGTGIGLVISKRLAELMGGRVGFHSVIAEGSLFWLDLPAEAPADVAPTPVRAAPRAAARGPLATSERRMVLYVEDNPANASFMRDLLGTLDEFDLLTVPTAELGVEVARERQPDIVIMDINLPGMSGLEALRMLRGFPETKEIPVIALSAAASERDKQRGVQAGFFRYLTKPVKVDELLDALEALRPAPDASRCR